MLLLSFLVRATSSVEGEPLWVLWVSSHEGLCVFPPAWFSRGISPERILFAQSAEPVKELKRVLMHPFFRLIVLDSPKRCTQEDCFFLNRQARNHHQVVVLVRDFFLSNLRGNIWARLRLNCWKQHHNNHFMIRTVKGLTIPELTIAEPCLR